MMSARKEMTKVSAMGSFRRSTTGLFHSNDLAEVALQNVAHPLKVLHVDRLPEPIAHFSDLIVAWSTVSPSAQASDVGGQPVSWWQR